MSGRWPFGELVPGAYGVIQADPPWRFLTYRPVSGDAKKRATSKSPERHYDCMDFDALLQLPVQELAARDCALVMWTTAPFLALSLQLMASWGFTYKTAGAWAKQSARANGLAFGTGYIFRSAAEFYLVGTRGSPTVTSRRVRNLIVAPVMEHSRKPDQLHTDLEQLWPKARRCELFARRQRAGWDCWGNQLPSITAKRGRP